MPTSPDRRTTPHDPGPRTLSGPFPDTVGRGGVYLYALVHDLLQNRIASGALPGGAVLKEGTIAAQIGTSRAPVRRALRALAHSGTIRAATGQGYVVGTEPPRTLTPREIHDTLHDGVAHAGRTVSAERIIADVHDAIVAVMPFGHYRILESELGEHFGVSRTVAREVLWRLMEQRFIHKDRKSHWIVPQLSARDIRDTLEMRRAIEPHALRLVAGVLDPAFLACLSARIVGVVAAFPNVTAGQIDTIEDDVCHRLFDGLNNSRMRASIRRNQIPLVVPQLFRRNFPLRDDLPALRLYDQIVRALIAGSADAAALLLDTHLENASALTLARLRVLSVLPPPSTDLWLCAIH